MDRTKKRIEEFMRDGDAVDAAMTRAFGRAVEAHRQAGVPMVVEGDEGEPALIDPRRVETPEEARIRRRTA